MTCAIQIKYKKPFMLPRTPIIITTNHPIWRFCTNEQPMFENRSWIFQWEHNCKDVPYTPRTSEHCCKCRYCTASRGCSSPHGESEPCRVQRTKQPLPTGEQRSIWTESAAADVCSGPMRGTGTGTSRSDSSPPRCSSSSAEICSTDDPGSASSSSTTTVQQLGHKQHGPEYSDLGIPCTSTLARKLLESYRSRQHHGNDPGRAGAHSSRKHIRRGNDSGARPHSSQRSIISYVESMEPQTLQTQEIPVPTKKQKVDRVLSTTMNKPISFPMYVPSRQDWREYLSFLYHWYG
ncbi:nonstructural protein 1 [Galliform chaphamaparvovirus 16]|nr:nonstructural protein 1 [Galliform chaphamaparvovirus 16]